MLKVLLLLVLFAGLLAAAPSKSGLIIGPAVKPKSDPTNPVASALKLVAKGSGGGGLRALITAVVAEALGDGQPVCFWTWQGQTADPGDPKRSGHV